MIPFLSKLFSSPQPARQSLVPDSAFSEIVNKDWGASKCLHKSDRAALYELTIFKNSWCSIHYHNRKRQIFMVNVGAVLMVEFDETGKTKTAEKLMLPGDVYHTPSRIRHQFIGMKASIATELYLPSRYDFDDDVPWRGQLHPHWHVREDDIVRLTEGGRAFDEPK